MTAELAGGSAGSVPDATRVTVTPDGQDRAVWAPVIDAAPRVSPAVLARDLAGLGAWPRLLVVAAHPDDETLGLGRLAYAWSRRAEVVGLLASAGEACLDHVDARPAGLAERRVAEWRIATDRLGFGAVHTLGLPDGTLGEHEDYLAERLTALLDATGEQAATSAPDSRERHPTVLAAPWRHDPHPDHRAVGRAVARVGAEFSLPVVEYPVWASFWGRPETLTSSRQRLLVVEHDEDAERARAEALAAFTSQLEPLGPTLTAVLPPPMLTHHDQQLVLVSERSRA